MINNDKWINSLPNAKVKSTKPTNTNPKAKQQPKPQNKKQQPQHKKNHKEQQRTTIATKTTTHVDNCI